GTGNRRFWPVTVTACDTDALAHDRNQLFGEAVHLFRGGTAWWPDSDFERDHIEREQEGRFITDEWEGMIAEAVARMDKTTVGEVAEKLFIGRDRVVSVMCGRPLWRKSNLSG
ncbi:MAG: VapE family protein, partial [Moraxellaceae bacterium]|nr:VapE family protein [Moraxellaceae bacterium]